MAYEEREGGFQRDSQFERKMYKGEWKCSECGAPINELPFEPDPNRLDQLKCRDCHRKFRASFRRDRY